jgi:acyl-CoA reductase-like NAD-dependent aldehyde dehydrogenase
MMKFHALVCENAQELAELIVKENGKNITEALADGKKYCCRFRFSFEITSLVKDSFYNTVIVLFWDIYIAFFYIYSCQRK